MPNIDELVDGVDGLSRRKKRGMYILQRWISHMRTDKSP